MKKRLLAAMLALCMTLTMFPAIATSAADELLETKVIENGVTHQVSTGSAITPEDNIEDLVTPKPDNAAPINEELDQNNSQQETTEMQPKLDIGNVASGTCGKNGDNVRWSLDADGVNGLGATLTISGTGEMEDYSLTKPSPWSSYSNRIISVIIKDGIVNIGKYAFYDLTHIMNAVIANGVNVIGEHAFQDCINLKNIEIPDTIVNVDDFAFKNCMDLRYIILPNVKFIGRQSFEFCSGLISITTGNNLEEIGAYAFNQCYGLHYMKLPDSLLRIQERAFFHCYSLHNIEIPNSVTSIGECAFEQSGLTSVIISCNLTKMDYAFSGCLSLQNVVISGDMSEIGLSMFKACSALKKIFIPNSVKRIQLNAFDYSYHLVDIYFEGKQDEWNNIDVKDGNDILKIATIHYQCHLL